MGIQLSIIIPYYNTLKYTKRLFKELEPQLNEQVEVIIVDDGCNEKELDKLNAKVIHLPTNSNGASKPRNVGLDIATGEYIAFIDSDDMISDDYIEKIFKAFGSDIIFLSWKSKRHDVKMITHPPKWNCSVWCRVFKKEIIGDVRFDENLRLAEDWVFINNIRFNTANYIRKTIYFYNCGRIGSITTGDGSND